MASRPLNDDEVLSEMNKMVCVYFDSTDQRISADFLLTISPIGQVAFIKQEAFEKARELKIKADEEFAIEKVCALPRFSSSTAKG
jgi:V-type H+-transporting ATPase subunit E